MTPKAGAKTTRPSPDTADAGRTRPVYLLRWLSPAPAIVVLERGVVFGREPACTSLLAGEDASRRHATVTATHPLPTLRDLDSRNGTYVDGKRIDERPVAPGNVVRMGDWVGLVQEMDPNAGGVELREIGAGWWGGQTLARAIEPAQRAARTDLPVVVHGETGTGKEGLARSVHAWSGRPGAFVAVNCAALPEAIAEAELFGYRKGAFTGAERASLGHFRAAHQGTLFLDELLELPPALQAKLLRVLEQREVQPLGESRPVAVDVRIVCATQESLASAVAERRFRADLHARLDGLTVELPALRARREDIVPLFQLLLQAEGRRRTPAVDAKLMEALLLYDWPLNVRELVSLVRRLVAVHGHEPTLRRGMLPERMTAGDAGARSTPPKRPAAQARVPTDDEAAFEQLVGALRQCGGNVSRAAAALGISRARAYRLLDARPDFDVASLRDGSD